MTRFFTLCQTAICGLIWFLVLLYLMFWGLYFAGITSFVCTWNWPCEQLNLGCDDRINSGKTCDVCGLCGGNNVTLIGSSPNFYCQNTATTGTCSTPTYPPPPARGVSYKMVDFVARSHDEVRAFLEKSKLIL